MRLKCICSDNHRLEVQVLYFCLAINCVHMYLFFFWFIIVALEMSENNMCSVFRDVDDVDWHLISQKLKLNHVLINDNCLRQTLRQWYSSTKGDPWTTWRKLSIVVQSEFGSKAGEELRQQAGVGA